MSERQRRRRFRGRGGYLRPESGRNKSVGNYCPNEHMGPHTSLCIPGPRLSLTNRWLDRSIAPWSRFGFPSPSETCLDQACKGFQVGVKLTR